MLPPVAAALLFCVCFVGYNIFNNSVKITYTNVKERDNVVLSCGGEAVMIDISDGSYSPFHSACKNAHKTAVTEFEGIVLTHYHERHISSIDRLLGAEMVRGVYLPLPENVHELEIMNNIVLCAKDHGVPIKTYKRENEVEIGEFSIYLFKKDVREGSSKSIISFSVDTGNGILTYADASWHLGEISSEVASFVACSDALILGSHGPFPPDVVNAYGVEYPQLVVGANIGIFAASPNMPAAESKLMLGSDCDGALVAKFSFEDR